MAKKLDPYEALELVEDEESFLTFLEALKDDYEDMEAKEAEHPSSQWAPFANDWTNAHLGAFLEAAVAFGRGTRRIAHEYPVADNPWRRCADIICAAKVYE